MTFLNHRELAAALFLIAGLFLTAASEPAADAAYCAPGEEPRFRSGFANLKAHLGERMGHPVECEHAVTATGDTAQQTTAGRATYTRNTNTAAFTDGYNHWALTARGLLTWTGDPLERIGGFVPAPSPSTGSDDDAGASLEAVTLASIFAPAHSPSADLDPKRVRTLLVTGDVALVRLVNLTTASNRDFIWPFRRLADLLREADLTLINLEGPLVPGCPLRTGGMVFCGDPRNVAGLEHAGVDVVALANNHMLNHGQAGLGSTRDSLRAAGIVHAGYGVAAIRQFEGLLFGFLAYDAIGQPPDVVTMAEEIGRLRDRVDVLVVMFHWGAEYTRIPAPGPGRPGAPRDIARAAVDAGADLVVGNHPHWFQGVELYRGRLIAYSHGNFVFDQRWSEETQQGMVGRYTFYDQRLIDAEFIPIRIDGWGQPRPAEEPERTRLLDIMRKASEALTPYD